MEGLGFNMDWKNIDPNCESRKATPEEMREYLNEIDIEKRIELAYGYQIPKNVMYPEDYKRIMKEIDDAIEESLPKRKEEPQSSGDWLSENIWFFCG